MAGEVLRASEYDPEIYVLALKAARQADLAKRGQPHDERDVSTLVSRLRSDTAISWSPDSVRALAPPDVSIMSRALSAYSGAPPQTIEELAKKLDCLFGEFSKPLSDLPPEEIDKFIEFCVVLHDELLSQRRSIQESRRPRSKHRV